MKKYPFNPKFLGAAEANGRFTVGVYDSNGRNHVMVSFPAKEEAVSFAHELKMIYNPVVSTLSLFQTLGI